MFVICEFQNPGMNDQGNFFVAVDEVCLCVILVRLFVRSFCFRLQLAFLPDGSCLVCWFPERGTDRSSRKERLTFFSECSNFPDFVFSSCVLRVFTMKMFSFSFGQMNFCSDFWKSCPSVFVSKYKTQKENTEPRGVE